MSVPATVNSPPGAQLMASSTDVSGQGSQHFRADNSETLHLNSQKRPASTNIDYTLPQTVEAILNDPKITTINAVVVVHHEGHLLYGLRRSGLDEAGTWSVISGGMEKCDTHPIDAALRELNEETAYEGQFRSIKVLGGLRDSSCPEIAAIYILAEAQEAFTPSPHAETPEHTEWKWAPTAQCPAPAHSKMRQTQEFFFDSLPVENLIPKDGRLAGVHGTASWFSSFKVGKVVNGSVYGGGIYIGLSNSQGEGYAETARRAQSGLHGKYLLHVDVETNVHNGGYTSVVRAASAALIERALDCLRQHGSSNCNELVQAIEHERATGKLLTTEALVGRFAWATGTSSEEAFRTLAIKGKWVPGFCYVAWDPRDVSITNKITILPPALPKRVFIHAEQEMPSQFENAFHAVRELRQVLSWATGGQLGEAPGFIHNSIQDRTQLEMARKKCHSTIVAAAREYGLDEAEARYTKLHQDRVEQIVSALGPPEVLQMWAEHVPYKFAGDMARLFLKQPDIMRDPYAFVAAVVPLINAQGAWHSMEVTPRDSNLFSYSYEEVMSTLWKNLDQTAASYLQDPTSELSDAAHNAKARLQSFTEILQLSGESGNRQYKQHNLHRAVHWIAKTAAKVSEHRSLSECLLDEVSDPNNRERHRLHRQPSTRLALQIAEILPAGTIPSEIQKLPSFVPKSGFLRRFFERRQVAQWLRDNGLSPKGIAAAKPALDQRIRSHIPELRKKAEIAEATAVNAKRVWTALQSHAADLEIAAQNYAKRQPELAPAFAAAVWEVQPGALSFMKARQTTIGNEITLGTAESMLNSWGIADIGRPLHIETTLSCCLSYFNCETAADRAIQYAHDHRIMAREDLHPSWTTALLDELDQTTAQRVTQIDREDLLEASYFTRSPSSET